MCDNIWELALLRFSNMTMFSLNHLIILTLDFTHKCKPVHATRSIIPFVIVHIIHNGTIFIRHVWLTREPVSEVNGLVTVLPHSISSDINPVYSTKAYK